MDNFRMRRFFHGVVLRDFCLANGLEATKENIEAVKKALKKSMLIASTEDLSNDEYRQMIDEVIDTSAQELGIEIPLADNRLTMTELLIICNNKYKQQNDERTTKDND